MLVRRAKGRWRNADPHAHVRNAVRPGHFLSYLFREGQPGKVGQFNDVQPCAIGINGVRRPPPSPGTSTLFPLGESAPGGEYAQAAPGEIQFGFPAIRTSLSLVRRGVATDRPLLLVPHNALGFFLSSSSAATIANPGTDPEVFGQHVFDGFDAGCGESVAFHFTAGAFRSKTVGCDRPPSSFFFYFIPVETVGPPGTLRRRMERVTSRCHLPLSPPPQRLGAVIRLLL